MQLGIVGLPTSGKTTLFNALTGSDLPTHAAGTGKMEVHTGVVAVPDPRLETLQDLLGPPKRVPAQITFADVGGLGGADRGAGLGGQLRNRLEQMDGFVHVVRVFHSDTVAHPEGDVDPQRDVDLLDAEFVLADLMLVENRLARVQEDLGKGKKEDRAALTREAEVLEPLRAALEDGALLRDGELPAADLELLSGYGLLTLKPALVVLNTSSDDPESGAGLAYDHAASAVLAMSARLEMELAQLEPGDAAEFMADYGLDELARGRVIREAYALMGLHTFFTHNDDEVRAWALPVGATALDAAETIHTDLARGFIRAEVAPYEALVEAGGWNALKTAGQLQTEGKDYVVRDGDVLLIRFNV